MIATETNLDGSGRFGDPIDRGWNHLEEIRSTLADLQGSGSLAQELIQNADDAKDASEIVFEFTDDALVVRDNGGFRKCSNPAAPECDLYEQDHRLCDFHAFRELGGATKRNDPMTTGAFGIGFLSVYQVTDLPEIISAGLHWVVDEAKKKQLPCLGCERDHDAAGTQVILPWVVQRTRLRTQLGAEIVSDEMRTRLILDFTAAIPSCMLFLRRIKKIEVSASGRTRTFTRAEDDRSITISGPDGYQDKWLVVRGSFEKAAKPIRSTYSSIIGSRAADVVLAFRADDDVAGRLYATLPTQVATELPLHINASFFPRRDRKGVLLDAGPQAEWNKLAISAAADALASSCVGLSRALGPSRFWKIVRAASQLETHHSVDARALQPLWEALAAKLPESNVMWTASNAWEVVERTVLAPPSARMRQLLAELGVPTVSPAIRPDMPHQKLRLRLITLERLINALEYVGIPDGCSFDDLPAWLREEKQREALRTLMAELVDKEKDGVDDELANRLKRLALWDGVDGAVHSFAASWLTDRDTARVFEPFMPNPLVYWPGAKRLKKLGAIGDPLTVDRAVEALVEADSNDFSLRMPVVRWLGCRSG